MEIPIFPSEIIIFPWFSHGFPMVFTIFLWFSYGFPMVFPNPHGPHLRLHGASTRHPTPWPRSATSPGSMARSSRAGLDGLTVDTPALNSLVSVGGWKICLRCLFWYDLKMPWKNVFSYIYIYIFIWNCIFGKDIWYHSIYIYIFSLYTYTSIYDMVFRK